MRKIYLLLVAVLLTVTGTMAQFAVTTNGGSGLAATYPDLAAAVTALNGATITSPVVITCPAGTETNPAGGYAITATGTAANTIVIQGAGAASVITAPNPAGTAGALNDAIFKIIGGDYITIEGFAMNENAANTTTTAGTNNMVEWGVALLYATTTNGAQNCTIQNNTITLNRTYQNTFGIYSNSTHSSTAPTTSATATTAAGGNTGLKIYGNSVSNVNQGIVIVGPTAAADHNTGIDIGGTGGVQANTITNYGTTGTFSGFANVSGTVFGILIRNSTGYNVSYNSITSSVGGVTAGTLRGIYNVSASNTPTGTYTNNINNNTIALTYGVASGIMQGITVEGTNATATSTQNINNNNFTALTASIASSVAITAISAVAPHLNLNITGNTFTNIATNTTGSFTFFGHSYSMPVAGVQTISNNSIVTSFNKTGAGGTVTISTTGASSPNGSSHIFTNNNFSNITVTGATAITGVSNTDGSGTSPNRTVTGNTFNNWTGGTSAIIGMTYSYIGTTSNYANNVITNITGQSAITGIIINSTFNGGTPLTINDNTINNLTSTGTGGNVVGISCSNTSTSIAIRNNVVHTLSSTGASTVSGITISGSNAAGTNVFKNNIYNLSNSNATPTVSGITISGGTLTNAYNNFISDLRSPNANAAAPIYGINVSGSTNAGIYYNTIALGKAATLTSVGAQFGVTGIGYSSSTNTTLRNNIVWIDATPVGTGTVAAVRRSAAGVANTAPTAANFNSNNNIYHVLLAPGAPPVAANINKYLYLEGNVTTTATNGYGVDIGQPDVPAQNLKSDPNFNTACGLYKTFMGSRETATFTENNLITVGPNTLAPTGVSFAAENAQVMTTPSITDDYSNVARSATPDIGALEFAGTGVDAVAPTISFTNLPNTICLTAPTLSAVITDASGVNTTPGLAPRLYYRKGGAVAEADIFGTYPADNNNTFNGWKYVEATGTAPNFSFAIDYSLLTSAMVVGDSLTYFVVAQDLATTPNVGRNAVTFPGSFCPTSVVMPSTGAVPTSNSLGYRIVQIGTVQPSTTAVNAGSIDNQVLRIDIPANSCYGNITQLNFTNASTNITDISNARVYYTTTATFSTTTPFGTAVANPGATFSVTGTQASAASGTNYFWLVYDIACNAPSTAGNVADASLVDAVTSIAGSLTPSVTNPTGTRLINALTPPVISTNQPSTSSIPQGAKNVQVLRVDVPGSICIGNITQLDFTNNSTALTDVTKARVYYTTTTTFSTAIQFGADVLAPGATFSITGTQASVATGTNYFWLVFDLDCAAVVANTVDAGNTGVVTTLSTYVPGTPNPTGTRAITALTTGDNIQTAAVAILGSAGGNPYDIAGKSVQLGEPTPILNSQPTATNGAGTSNYSWGTAAGGTAWYRLDVPTTGYGSSGNLLIRATTPTSTPSADAQVALWKFPNMVPGTCADPANFTGGYMLAANDDGICTGTGYWGASANGLNAVIRVRLTPGQTYYVQLDGFGTNVPNGDLIIEDLADPGGKNVSNNGFGAIHNPTGVNMLSASYEVIGDDGWTYYYNNNGTETDIADDVVLMGLNWSTSTTYLWNGTSATGNDLMNHIRRTARVSAAPITTGPSSATGTDAFVVWSGKNSACAASADLKPTAPYVGTSVLNWWMMPKFWNVFPNVQPTTSIGVRYFFSDADFTALQSVVVAGGGVLPTIAELQMIKATKSPTTHYTNAEIDPCLGHAAILSGTVTTPAWTPTAGVQPTINQAQYSITTFSGGGGGSTGTPASVLPVTLTSVRAESTGATNTVYWTTATEQNNRKFVVERSTSGNNFTAIGEVATRAINGNSNTALNYSFADANPVQGKQFYRLQMVDNGGSKTYSAIVTLRRGAGKLEIVDVRPNPTTGTVYFNILGSNSNVNIAVRDLNGKEVIRKGLVQSNSFSIDLSKLANGLYILEAIDVQNGEKALFKVLKN